MVGKLTHGFVHGFGHDGFSYGIDRWNYDYALI